MSDVRLLFPNMKEKTRRTARGKKPAKYIAGAPSLPEITSVIFKEVLLSHEEIGQGVRNFYFLVRKEGMYGYLHLRDMADKPFSTNCSSYAVLQQVYNDVTRMAAWNPSIVHLVDSITSKSKNPPLPGSNFKFIEAVKEKFRDQFETKPIEIKPLNFSFPKYSKWDKYYGSDGYLTEDLWYDDPWNRR